MSAENKLDSNNPALWSEAIFELRQSILFGMDGIGKPGDWDSQVYREHVLEVLAYLEFAKIAADRARRIKFKVDSLL